MTRNRLTSPLMLLLACALVPAGLVLAPQTVHGQFKSLIDSTSALGH